MEMLELGSIVVNNKYLRTNTNVDKLKKSIETVGLINPLVINKNNELIAGGRRYSALSELGYSHVPVTRVEKNEKEQELISIDENLVRKDLNKLEFERCLSRGKEIYEELYPEAKKVDEEDLTTPEGQEVQVNEPNEKRSFIDMTAEKTGLSKRVIKSAIDRDENSSKKVKDMRASGDLSATQVNELIKLSKEQQDKVVEMVADKPAKVARELVKKTLEADVATAIEEVVLAPQLPKEYIQVQSLAKRLNKFMGKIILEEITSEHKDMKKIKKDLMSLRGHIDSALNLLDGETHSANSDEESLDETTYMSSHSSSEVSEEATY